jgi:hypothetical protein
VDLCKYSSFKDLEMAGVCHDLQISKAGYWAGSSMTMSFGVTVDVSVVECVVDGYGVTCG